MSQKLGFEDLEVWKDSLDLAGKVLAAIQPVPIYDRLAQQITGSVSSIAQNIAEGSGRYSRKEHLHFLYIARGSLFETITLLEILRLRASISDENFDDLRRRALLVSRKLNGYIAYIKRLKELNARRPR